MAHHPAGVGHHDGQYPATTVIRFTGEPRDLDWMRFVRQAKFVASHDEVEWIMPVRDMLEKYVVFGDSEWGGSESRRSTSGTLEPLGSHPSTTAAQINTSLFSPAER